MGETPREIELKLAFDPAQARALRDRGIRRLGAEPGGATHLAATYFDTGSQALRKRGLSLRVRREGNRHIQTLKAEDGAGAGLFDRAEWEWEVAGSSPDLDRLADTPFAKLVHGQRLRDELVPVFRTEVDRTIWRLAGPDREVEIAVDLGTVTARDRTEPIAEIELELKVGSPDRLFELARLLDRSSPLAIAVETKSARGYALLAPKVATKAAPVVLRRGMTTAVAFQTVARSCLRQFRLNEPLVRARSPEGLHQARVALRRLRSALSVFGPALADRRLPAIKSALRRVSGQLGEARNLDVYLAKTLGPASTRSPEDADLAAFLAEVRAEREAVYERIQATLRSRRFRIFLLDCLAWIEAGPWLTAADAKLAAARDRPVEDFAMDSLRRRRRKLKRAGRALALLGAPARHQVRIDAKKLRYASEFFGALAEGGKEKRRYVAFTEALAALQEELGALNDAATGDDLTRELLTRLGREPDFAARFAPPALQPDPSGQAVEPGGEEARHLARAVAAHAAFVEAKRFLR